MKKNASVDLSAMLDEPGDNEKETLVLQN